VNHREEILSKVRSIPSLPAAAVEVARLIQDPEADFSEVAGAIGYDPGLTANVLRVANSAYYGGSRSISSVKEAVVRLGAKRIFQMVVASSVQPLVHKPVKGYDLPPGELWEHSVAVALGTDEIASFFSLKPPDYAFTAALVHDVGKIVLGTFVEVDAAPIMELAYKEKLSFDLAERRVLGIDHAEAGAALLEAWNLPQRVVDVVRWHHQPECFEGDTLLCDLVHAADQVSMVIGVGAGADGLNYRPSSEAMDRLGFTAPAAEAVMCRIVSALDEVRAAFSFEKRV
jgi:putative nucleotidyltransferase with HDIG domain